jgi:hypothetical protein
VSSLRSINLHRFQDICRSDLNHEAPSTRRIKAVPFQLKLDLRSHTLNERHETPLEEIEGRSSWIMRSTLDLNPARPGGCDQRRQDRLKYESSAACRTNRETKVPSANLARHKRKRFGTQRSPLDFSRANFCRRLDCCQVLPQQSRLLTICANVLDSEGLSGYK